MGALDPLCVPHAKPRRRRRRRRQSCATRFVEPTLPGDELFWGMAGGRRSVTWGGEFAGAHHLRGDIQGKGGRVGPVGKRGGEWLRLFSCSAPARLHAPIICCLRPRHPFASGHVQPAAKEASSLTTNASVLAILNYASRPHHPPLRFPLSQPPTILSRHPLLPPLSFLRRDGPTLLAALDGRHPPSEADRQTN